jgi:beta-glucosidase
VHNEGINGFLHDSGSQFPTAWAQAATWDPELVSQASAITAAHADNIGVQLILSPVMDLSRDVRWGRVHETYGEDPELVSRIAIGFVRGIHQGADVLACAKHFVGYGASEGGLNQAVSHLGRRILSDEYAEPFRRTIAEAGLVVTMNSYNEVDGIPAAADRWLLTELLRDGLGFRGLVVSDYDSINMLRTVYHTATTEQEAGAQALEAGLDVELPSDPNFAHLADAVRAGRLSEEVIDRAVGRVLRVKERVGLIPEMRRPSAPPAPVDVQHAAAVAAEIAEHSIVLLQNDGALPLTPGASRVLVTGPAADELRIHFGAYTSVSSMEMQLGHMALRAGEVPGIDPETFNFTDIFQARMPGIEPRFEAKTRELHPDALTVVEAIRAVDASVAFAPFGSFDGDSLDSGALDAALTQADVVIVAVGERTGWVGNNTAGEGQSTAAPVLPGGQRELVTSIAASGKTVVTVLVSGRPLVIPEIAEASGAVVLAPLLGAAAGSAIADVLYGRTDPSGRLPNTFPRAVGQVPMYHGHHFGSGYDHPTGTRHGYGDLTDQRPLFPFGHGLSYTDFTIDAAGEGAALDGDSVTVRAVVTNTGDRDGATVVQLYARDETAAVVRPVRQLVDFARVELAAGESAEIELGFPLERLHYTMLDGARGVEAGEVTVMIAASSADIRHSSMIEIPESRA